MKLERAATQKAVETTFYVTGDTGEKYTVHFKRHRTKHRRVWTCNCRDFTERQVFTGGTCKHIDFTIVSLDAPVPQNNNVLSGGVAETLSSQQPEKPTVKSVLDQVVALLVKRSTFEQREASNDLWAVLTALRGPDQDHSDKLKEETTARIRHALGLKDSNRFTVESGIPLGLEGVDPDCSYMSTVVDLVSSKFPSSDNHFRNHYDLALRTLVKLGYLRR